MRLQNEAPDYESIEDLRSEDTKKKAMQQPRVNVEPILIDTSDKELKEEPTGDIGSEMQPLPWLRARDAEACKPMEGPLEMAKSPAWTRKAGKNPKGGLNAKGRASYNKANPGKPGLKPPAPNPTNEKDAGRRKSFCSRMKGMKAKNTSAETARDPNSRINKSLRAWNC